MKSKNELYLIMVILFFILSLNSCMKEEIKKTISTTTTINNITTTTTIKVVAKKVDYKIFRQWSIPNGGYSKVIVINPSNRNRNDLELLGYTLKNDTKNDRNAFIWVYDDIKAAEMQQRAMDLNDTDGSFYDKHFIANYRKNINTGFHQYDVMVDGLNGKIVTIEY